MIDILGLGCMYDPVVDIGFLIVVDVCACCYPVLITGGGVVAGVV